MLGKMFVGLIVFSSALCAQIAIGDSLETFSNPSLPASYIVGSSQPAPIGGGVSIANDALVISHVKVRTGNPLIVRSVSLDTNDLMLCGDFTLEVDYGLDQFPISVRAGYSAESALRLTRWRDGAPIAGISRLVMGNNTGPVPGGHYYRALGTNDALAASSFAPTGDNAGRLRINRLGSVITLAYESSTGWVPLRIDPNATTDHLWFSLTAESTATANFRATYDNLQTFDLNPPLYPGTGEGLIQRSSIFQQILSSGGYEPRTHGGRFDRKAVPTNSYLHLSVTSGPSLWSEPIVVACQFIPVATSPSALIGIPGAWLDPSQPGFDYIFNGYNDPAVWVQRLLPSSGMHLFIDLFNSSIPGTLVIQSWVVSPNATNGMMATTGAQVFDF